MNISPLTLAHAPTPLYRLERLSARWGLDLWIKRDDLAGSGLTGNKVRKLEYLLADAIQRRADTVITCGGVQSNHCRATAIAAARMGLSCELLLRGDPDAPTDGNLLLDRISGARIRFISEADYRRDLEGSLNAIAAEVRARGGRPYIIVEGGSDAIGAWSFVEAIREARRQCERAGVKPDRIVAAVGSGGTHAGMLVGTRLEGWKVQVVSVPVSYDAPETTRRIKTILDNMNEYHSLGMEFRDTDILLLNGYRNEGYAKAGEKEFRVIAEVAQNEGVLVDPVYTGKAMRAIKMEGAAGMLPGTTLFWHTGGMFGLFPFRAGLGSVI